MSTWQPEWSQDQDGLQKDTNGHATNGKKIKVATKS